MLKKVIISIAGIVVVLILAELALKIFFGFGTPPLMIADKEIGYLFKENQDITRFGNKIQYNAYHQRSDTLNENPDFRILMVGDSVTNGGVLTDQTDLVTELLEEKINKIHKLEVEVLNASAGSWGIENEYEYMKKFGFFDSDVVILQINTVDFYQKKSTSDKVGSIDLPDHNPPSAIYELLNRYVINRYFSAPDQNLSTVNNKLNSEDQFKNYLYFLSEIIELVKRNNKTLVVILTPIAHELEQETLVDERNAIVERLNIEEIAVINFLDSKHALNISHFRDFIHLNENGNRLISNSIYDLLKEKDLVPNNTYN